MSKCAFSAQTLTALIPTLRALEGRAELHLDYVAKVEASVMTSPYGDDDLKGARYQLCAKDQGARDAWLTFLSCQNQDWQHVPQNAAACAKVAQLDAEGLQACAKGERGAELLAASVARSSGRKVSATPSLFVNGKAYAGGRTARLFARSLCGVMQAPRPKACEALPEPVAVPVTIVADAACTAAECGYANFKRFLDTNLEGLSVLEVDARSTVGSEMLAGLGRPATPFALFSPAIEQEPETFARLRAAGLRKLPSDAGYAMVIRAPSASQGDVP